MACVSNDTTQTGSETVIPDAFVTKFRAFLGTMSQEKAFEVFTQLVNVITPLDRTKEKWMGKLLLATGIDMFEWNVLFKDAIEYNEATMLLYPGTFKPGEDYILPLQKCAPGILTMYSKSFAKMKIESIEECIQPYGEKGAPSDDVYLGYAKYTAAAPQNFLEAVKGISSELHELLVSLRDYSDQ
jgi:hypothetical protein